MNILVACEFSGRVRDAFRAKGHNAISCDLLPSERPGPHYQGDVRDILNEGWDLVIAHPPCTYLAVTGRAWWRYRQKEQEEALQFVQSLMDAPIPRIAIENPIGIISTRIRKPDQIIQPWMFGETWSKATCLWLKNLPGLFPTEIVSGRMQSIENFANTPDRWKRKSRTFPGFAQAMADQWLVESAGVA